MLPTYMMNLTIQHPTTDSCLIYRSPSAPREHVSAHSQEVHLTSLRRRARVFTNHPSYTRNSYFFLPANPVYDFSFASLGLLLSFLWVLWPLLQDLSSAFPVARSMGYLRLYLDPAGQKGFCIPRHQAKFCSYRMISPICPPYSIMCGKFSGKYLGGVNGLRSKNWISRMGAYASDTCSRHAFVSLRCFGSCYGRHIHQWDSRDRASSGGLHVTSRLQRIPATLGYLSTWVCSATSLPIASRIFLYISGPSHRKRLLSHHLSRPAPCLATTTMLPYLRCSPPSQSNDCDRYPPYGLGGSATKSTCLN